MTWVEEEIKEIQRGGIDWTGAPLAVDGKPGAKTLWWLGILSLSEQRQAVIRMALGYHHQGMGEATGNNDGVWIDKLLKPQGLKNQPWCIAFCSHVYRECGVEWKKYHTSAYQLITWAEHNGKLVTEPLPGDLFAFLYPKKPSDKQISGHGGIVLAKDKQFIYNVDGNVTNSVRAGRRLIRPEMKFIRVMSNEYDKLTIPVNMPRLDNLGDR